MTATNSKMTLEIEIAISGEVVPYRPATGPSYSSGGDPAEGGYAEDIEITGIGILTRRDAMAHERGSHPHGVWVTTSVLDGIDLKNPEIQKLFWNILDLTQAEASDAIMSEGAE